MLRKLRFSESKAIVAALRMTPLAGREGFPLSVESIPVLSAGKGWPPPKSGRPLGRRCGWDTSIKLFSSIGVD